MPFRALKVSIATIGVALGMGTVPAPSDAGLCDWLLGRSEQPVSVNRPVLAQPYCPTAAAPVAPCAPQMSQQTVVRYVPQTCFRSRWVRVPVTVYIPANSVDPRTGRAVLCMRPCTTYTWQVRRVPYVAFRPVHLPVAAGGAAVCGPSVVGPGHYGGAYQGGVDGLPRALPASPAALPPAALPPDPNGSPGTEPADIPPRLDPQELRRIPPWPDDAPSSKGSEQGAGSDDRQGCRTPRKE